MHTNSEPYSAVSMVPSLRFTPNMKAVVHRSVLPRVDKKLKGILALERSLCLKERMHMCKLGSARLIEGVSLKGLFKG